MLELARRVRFCINPAVPLEDVLAASRHNTFAAWPGMIGLGAFYEFEVRCQGEADEATGYLLNISAIDEAVRRVVLPAIHRQRWMDSGREPTLVLATIIAPLGAELPGILASVTWRLTPYYSITMSAATTDRVTIAQQFEFAAAHRLHCESLSQEENRRVFGRCNNPNGHGHNYRLEVAIESPLAHAGAAVDLSTIEQIVDQRIIQRLDHTNLNVDVPEFAKVNPSVENIAKVCHGMIREEIERAGGRIAHVTVWETEKTSCTYRG